MAISLGEHSKLTAHPRERKRIRKFYQEVLGCKMIRTSEEADAFRLGGKFSLVVLYDSSALTQKEALKSIWLELRSDRPEELKQAILKFGIKEIDYWDKDHFYFQSPGGQVFRVTK